MTTGHPDALVTAYLRHLDAAATGLPPERRAELVTEIGAHIDEALLAAGAANEVAIRNVLDRLGPPEEIAWAAIGPRAEPSVEVDRPGRLEIAALLMLAVGGVLPIVGWVIGVALVLMSAVWSRRDKTVGLLLGLLPVAVVAVVLFASAGLGDIAPGTEPLVEVASSDGGLGSFEWLVLTWGFVSGLPSAAYLAYRLRHGGPARARGALAATGATGN